MDGKVFSLDDIKAMVKPIAQKYQVEAIYLFGSYARGEADEESDLDFLVFGGLSFKRILVLDIAEELRIVFQKEVDAFEISELNTDSEFYRRVMEEKVIISRQSAVGSY